MEQEEEEECSLRGHKWGLSSSFISPLIGAVSLCVRAAQCSPCLCLSPLIKTFGFLWLALEECVSVHVCGMMRDESGEESEEGNTAGWKASAYLSVHLWAEEFNYSRTPCFYSSSGRVLK